MKLGEALIFKELLLEHEISYGPKEYNLRQDYGIVKKDSLHRIDMVEEARMKEKSYLKDLDEKVAWLKKKHSVDFGKLIMERIAKKSNEAAGLMPNDKPDTERKREATAGA